jgi:phosphotransferase system  glucose/maltose/N-acetylglucosamine-specific IIC component
MILLVLLATGILGFIIWPFVQLCLGMFAGVAGMNPGAFQAILLSLISS